MAASNYMLPPPSALGINNIQTAERWRRFKMAWSNYSVTTEVNTKDEAVQFSTLLTVVGEDAREVYSIFTWEAEGDEAKIVEKSQAYCQPRKIIPFE